jgi:hypothetical protein
MFYDNKTCRLQTYVLMSWISIDFYGSRLRSWSFLCVTFSCCPFCPCIMGFHSENFTNFAGHPPKPKTSFCDHLLVHNPIWVWSKILDGDSNSPQDYGIYTYFSSHPPLSFMLKGEHRSSMGEESLHHLWQMLCKYYVEKVPEEQKKKMKNEKLWWEEKKSKEKKEE